MIQMLQYPKEKIFVLLIILVSLTLFGPSAYSQTKTGEAPDASIGSSSAPDAERVLSAMKEVEPIVHQLMAAYNVPGVSIAVTDGMDVLYSKGLGLRNATGKEPVTPESVGGIGSATKMFTALAIMMLVSEDKIDLHSPIDRYLDIPLNNPKGKVTIHHLLSHSSGFPELFGSLIALQQQLGQNPSGFSVNNWQDWRSHLSKSDGEAAYPPGEKWIYFNDGFTFLQLVIESVSGQKYAEFLESRILEPLGMRMSSFDKGEVDSIEDKMSGHQNGVPMPHPFHELIQGSGGLISNVIELTHFLRLLINEGTYQEQTLFDGRVLDEMAKIQIPTPSLAGLVTVPVEEGYGYGSFITHNYCGETLIYHSGNTSVSGSMIMYLPKRKLGIAVIYNAGEGEPISYAIPMGLVAILSGRNPMEVITALRIDALFMDLTGEYETYRKILKARVYRKEGMLYFESLGNANDPNTIASPLIPYAPKFQSSLKFYTYATPVNTVDFEFFVDPKTNKMTLFTDRYLYHKAK